MSKDLDLLTVGYHKYEMDFGINCSVENLSYEEMQKFREMIVVAIGTAENMWRRAREKESMLGCVNENIKLTKSEEKCKRIDVQR